MCVCVCVCVCVRVCVCVCVCECVFNNFRHSLVNFFNGSLKGSFNFFYFNFSCCKAHDFCELNLRKPEKCGDNPGNIDQRFEYDAATDTCSEYYQYFLCIISVLSFFVVCIIFPKSLASTFPHSSIHT